MSNAPIPATVQAFIREFIRSAEQLDILLQLYFNREQEWSPEAIASAVFTTATSARAKLDQLVEDGLVTRVSSALPRYRYAPSSPEVDEGVHALGAAYRENRGGVLEAVFARNLDPLQNFSDAFKLGKKGS